MCRKTRRSPRCVGSPMIPWMVAGKPATVDSLLVAGTHWMPWCVDVLVLRMMSLVTYDLIYIETYKTEAK